MSRLKTVLAFLIGAASGAACAWYYLKETYAQRTEEEIASTKEAFHKYEAKLEAEIAKLRGRENNHTNSEDDSPASTPAEKAKEKGNTAENVKSKYHQYNPTPSPEPIKTIDNNVLPKKDLEAPYVISPDEFGEIEEYTKISLTYYADGILADENGIMVENIEEIVGDALNHFGEYEDDSVFCRSDPKRCDYEILQDYRRYADVGKGFPTNL